MALDRADDLHDLALEEEITLLGRVMDAVADVKRQLKTAEVDRALGVSARHGKMTSPALGAWSHGAL